MHRYAQGLYRSHGLHLIPETPLPVELDAVKNEKVLSSIIPGDFEAFTQELRTQNR